VFATGVLLIVIVVFDVNVTIAVLSSYCVTTAADAKYNPLPSCDAIVYILNTNYSLIIFLLTSNLLAKMHSIFQGPSSGIRN
jgi:hypothetical protein